MNAKKGFLLYFDSWPMVLQLPPDQRGHLLAVLFAYADRVWREEDVPLEELMAACPALSPQARMACGFMAANIRRDTRRWLSQQQSRDRCRAAQGQGRGPAPSASAAGLAQSDMEQMRRYLAELKAQDTAESAV